MKPQINFSSFPTHHTPLSFKVAIVGSGTASLNAAVQLKRLGVDDIIIITEGIRLGTSANTGSDKQTYYRLNPGAPSGDSIQLMAKDLFEGGSMHGDTALVEAALSARCFAHLCTLGVEFPHNEYAVYPGYRPDHDTKSRATSAGPHTSIMMHSKLLAECRRLGIMILDGMSVVKILTEKKKAAGIVALNRQGDLQVMLADYVVWGTGGPAALYADSAYPHQQTASLGVALMAGAKACNLSESQFGIASVEPRWNLSGSYQQVLPNYYSCKADGSDRKEFLAEYFPSPDKMCEAVFLKGYEWPFDVRKISGSSVIDLLVYKEKVVRGRKVFMDFRVNPAYPGWEFSIKGLPAIVREYLLKSSSTSKTPVERLKQMNQRAYRLYWGKGIDLEKEPLEIALSNQHLNGGLAVDKWWETSIENLFATGEVAGTHGIYRPGGSALNSGQVGGLRAAQQIAYRIRQGSTSKVALQDIKRQLDEIALLIKKALNTKSKLEPVKARVMMQKRASSVIGIFRNIENTEAAIRQNAADLKKHLKSRVADNKDIEAWIKNIDLLVTERAILDASLAVLEKLDDGRGSFLILKNGQGFDAYLKAASAEYKPQGRISSPSRDDRKMTDRVIETWFDEKMKPHSRFEQVRPLPNPDDWFETVWAEFEKDEVFEK